MPEHVQQQNSTQSYANRSISWWSWRPGVTPRTVMLIGSLITCVALLFTSIGLVSLILGILDSNSSPLHVPGTILGHAINGIDGQAHLLVSVHNTNFPPQVSAVAATTILQTLHDGEHIILDYTPHLHVLLALEIAGQRFPLQNGGMFSIFLGTFALLLLGLVLLPYPAILTVWAWRDLYGRGASGRLSQLTGRVIALREAKQTRANRPGLTPRTIRSWYGVALAPLETTGSHVPFVRTFAINREMHDALHEGECIRITYSAHLHYVYRLEPASE